MSVVEIVFFSNDRFSMLLGIALCSLFENKKGNYPINIYVIDSGISAKNKKRLAMVEQFYGFKINFIHLSRSFESEIPFSKLSTSYYQPIQSYHRLAINRFLPLSCNKVIDMDVDVIFRGDVAELFNTDLGGKTIGAVVERYPSTSVKVEHLKKLCSDLNFPIPVDSFYFNAGVLLIDLDLWRKKNIEKNIFELIRNHPEKLKLHDQDALNAILVGDVKELPDKFNFLTAQTDHSSRQDPLIVHFAGGDKPWYFFSTLPYRSEYIRYANQTPWKYLKYRKLMDIYFAKKYHLYSLSWRIWSIYKKFKKKFIDLG